jgi:hypothetical protein
MLLGVVAASIKATIPSISDPFWDDTHLLLNFNDALGSTTFVDDSQYANSVVRGSGTPTVVENAAMFDGKCLKGGNHPSVVNATLSNPEAATAFTVECYVIPIAGQQCGIFYAPNMSFQVDSSGNVLIAVSGYPRISFALTPGTRYHVAMTVEARGGTTYFALYVNGVKINEIGNTTAITLGTNFIVQIGRTSDSGFSYLNAYIDKYRLTFGLRYTETFTPAEY